MIPVKPTDGKKFVRLSETKSIINYSYLNTNLKVPLWLKDLYRYNEAII